jgi:hypothetical protein
MITNPAVLKSQRIKWSGSNGQFDRVAQVLSNATCQADVFNSLPNPPYVIMKRGNNPHPSAVYIHYEVVVSGQVMIRYRLTEQGVVAEVEIIPL